MHNNVCQCNHKSATSLFLWAFVSIADRLAATARAFPGGQKGLAKEIGVHRNTIGHWIAGRRSPNVEELRLIADTAGCDFYWLADGDVADSNSSVSRAPRGAAEDAKMLIPLEPDASELVRLPRLEVEASAGTGRLVVSEHRDGWMAVDRDWLSRYVSRAAQVGVIEAVGDSMAPTIRNRDLLLVEVRDGFTAQDLMRGGVYVLTLDGGLVVKRLSIDGDTLIVGSDNPAHAEIRVPGSALEERVKIHGIVFWSGGALETHR